jgi:hypothetical protein
VFSKNGPDVGVGKIPKHPKAYLVSIQKWYIAVQAKAAAISQPQA